MEANEHISNRRVRLRFAPSPTGGLHMGGVRTALFNYLFAKKHGGDFLLRIEDTDQNRYVKGAEEYIVQALKWSGITIDEGVSVGGKHEPYRQSERKEKGIYKGFATQLVESGHAYYAFDTADELEQMRKRLEAAKVVAPQYNAVSRQQMRNSLTLPHDEVERLINEGTPYVIRLKVPRNEEIRFHDIIRGWVVVNSSQVDDKVLLKSDGMPTYHLAHIVDDHLMEISHIVRGEEWLPSAPAHVLIWRYLGLEETMPLFAHLPLILRPDGQGKLSKRDKSGLPMFPLNWFDERSGESYVGYRESGFFPEAFVNMLALLGWNPGNNDEIFSMAELVQLFSFERVSKSGARFDPDKTKWFNQQYLRKKTEAELSELFLPVLKEKTSGQTGFELPDASRMETFCRLMKEKAHFVHEFWDFGHYFFIRPEQYDADVIKKRWNDAAAGFIQSLASALQQLPSFDATGIENCFKETAASNNISPGQVMQLFRVCLSGVGGGPAIFEMAEWLGKEECILRLQNSLNKIPAQL
jgi:glutamyl-tRNA synthetase